MDRKLLTLLLILSALSAISKTDLPSNKNLAIQQTAETWIGTGINNFDLTIIHFLQGFSQKSRFVDEYFAFIAQNNFFKGVVLMSALWWLWFLPDIQDRLKRRVMLILTMLSGFIALFIGRVLVITLPFRMRPINSPELHLLIPFGANNDGLAKLSSFPSDHAVLFYAISTGLFLVSKKTGVLAFMYTFIFITLSRVYLCYHYPTDVIGGAIIGIGVCYFICNNPWMQKVGKKVYIFSEEKPQFFYIIFMIITYQLIDLFGETRDLVSFFLHYL